MILHILQKELREKLLDLQFLTASLISIVLVVLTIVALAAIYRAQVADFHDRQMTQEDFIAHYGHLNRVGWMAQPIRPPSPYGYLVEGYHPEAGQENYLSNPMIVLFSGIDLIVIVTIIMSLFGILFSYHAVSGEREAGVLRLLLSAGAPRSTVVLGKYIGGCISLMLPFLIGLLAGVAGLALLPGVRLVPGDAAVLILLFIVSWIYISFFYGLGLYFSTRSANSSVSVLKSLFAWVVLVLILPNISPFLAQRVYQIPSKTKVDMEAWRIRDEERDKIVDTRAKELRAVKYADIASVLERISLKQIDEDLRRRMAGDETLKLRLAQYKKDWMDMVDEVNKEQLEKTRPLYEDLEQRSQHQEKLAKIFASVSPVGNYVFLATDLTESGIQADDAWNRQKEEYFTSMSPILMAIYNKALKQNPRLGVNDYIDLREFPRFVWREVPITERISECLWHLAVLCLLNIVILAASFFSIQYYDVR